MAVWKAGQKADLMVVVSVWSWDVKWAGVKVETLDDSWVASWDAKWAAHSAARTVETMDARMAGASVGATVEQLAGNKYEGDTIKRGW